MLNFFFSQKKFFFSMINFSPKKINIILFNYIFETFKFYQISIFSSAKENCSNHKETTETIFF
nr:TPA_asm: hypothetical protein [Nephila orb-weaver spider adintovirus]